VSTIAARIKAFEHVRDIPYRFNFRDRSKDTTSLSKSGMLKKLLADFGVAAYGVCCSYRWDSTRMPPELVAKAPHPESQHHFLHAFIPETRKWVRVDATWDSGLKAAGFPVAEWDGLDSTILAVTPLEIFSPDMSAMTSYEKENDQERFWHMMQMTYGAFYDDLNLWIESQRTPLTGRTSPGPAGRDNG